MNAKELTRGLGGILRNNCGSAPCPCCRPERRKSHNALTLTDDHTGKAARISVLRNHRWMGKRFFIDDAGKLQKQANGLFSQGSVTVREINNASELAQLTEELTVHEALCLGVPNGATDNVKMTVATRQLKRQFAQGSTPCLSRTKEDFDFWGGEGWLLIDYDTKGLPARVVERIRDVGGVMNALHLIWPQLDDGDLLVRPSSSAGVHIIGQEPCDNSGFHMFVRLKRAVDIPQALQALHSNCWLHGLGYHMISKSGRLLDRSIVDITVGSPERLIFTAPPILDDGIAREYCATTVREGSALNRPNAPLSAEWSRNRDIDRQRCKPAAEAQRAKYLRSAIKQRQHLHGETFRAAERVVTSRIAGHCMQDADILQLADGAEVTVSDLLDSIKVGDVISCADPIEGRQYNPTAAAVLWGQQYKSPILISHAHGEVTRYSFARFGSGRAATQGAAL